MDKTKENLPDSWYEELEAVQTVATRVQSETLPWIVDLRANNVVLPGPSRPVILSVKQEVAMQREEQE